MRGKTLATGWFFLFLSLASVASVPQPAPISHQSGSFFHHSAGAGDTAENPDDHVQESIERYALRRKG
ncbi:hypothetical protein [Kosakonia sp.]|uniref:hypothetical protein n=1 Tax=Kosakonia sp. TaxID=1916651 RepID=UPI0028998670|nr:hypothetical protein [Kosakonia sp.]